MSETQTHGHVTADGHGIVMLFGLLGTLSALEHAVVATDLAASPATPSAAG
jgi:hypothetical protein